MLLCCHGDRCLGCQPRSPWGLILLWLSLCLVLHWFHAVILILLSSLLLGHCHLCLHSNPHPLHIFHPQSSPSPRPPSQTRTASAAPPVSACQTGRRTSWTVSNRWSWPGRRPCLCGGRAPCRLGWRLSWRCPCTSAAAQRTSRAERSGRVADGCRQHLCSASSAAAAKTLAFCRFCSDWLMKTWSWV